MIGALPDLGLIRVQVKTMCVFRNGRWSPTVATRGGNQSWNRITKRFTPDRCDYLFVLVGDGRRWFIPAPAVEATTGLALGGPKYNEYEISPGQAIAA